MSSEELRRGIYSNLNLEETEALLRIWLANNRSEWSDEAFQVIKEILEERKVEIPEQGETVIYEDEKEEILHDERLEEWEAKLLDDEHQPEFYDTLEVITLKENLDKTAKAVIVVNILVNSISISYNSYLVGAYFPRGEEFTPLVYLIAIIITALSAALSIAIVYFPLKALSYILRILMEMEFNSRKAV